MVKRLNQLHLRIDEEPITTWHIPAVKLGELALLIPLANALCALAYRLLTNNSESYSENTVFARMSSS